MTGVQTCALPISESTSAFRDRGRDEAIATVLRHRLKDGVEGEQRVVGKVHLRDEPCCDRRAHQREVDVCGSPCIRMIAPRVGPGLDREEPILPVGSGAALPDAQKVGIERSGERGLTPVHVAATRIGLPDLDERVGEWIAVLVEYASRDDAALPNGVAQNYLVKIDKNTGIQTFVGDMGVAGYPQGLFYGMAFSDDGRLWTIDPGTPATLYQVDPTTGATTPVMTMPFGPGDLASESAFPCGAVPTRRATLGGLKARYR